MTCSTFKRMKLSFNETVHVHEFSLYDPTKDVSCYCGKLGTHGSPSVYNRYHQSLSTGYNYDDDIMSNCKKEVLSKNGTDGDAHHEDYMTTGSDIFISRYKNNTSTRPNPFRSIDNIQNKGCIRKAPGAVQFSNSTIPLHKQDDNSSTVHCNKEKIALFGIQSAKPVIALLTQDVKTIDNPLECDISCIPLSEEVKAIQKELNTAYCKTTGEVALTNKSQVELELLLRNETRLHNSKQNKQRPHFSPSYSKSKKKKKTTNLFQKISPLKKSHRKKPKK